MTSSPSISNLLPPRLSMDEYADFVEASLRDCDPALAVRQKEIEERIQTPFRMVEDTPVRPRLPTLPARSAANYFCCTVHFRNSPRSFSSACCHHFFN